MGCRNSQRRSDQEALCFEERAIASGWTAKQPIRVGAKLRSPGFRVAFFRIVYAPWVNHGLLRVLVAGDGIKPTPFGVTLFGSDAGPS